MTRFKVGAVAVLRVRVIGHDQCPWSKRTRAIITTIDDRGNPHEDGSMIFVEEDRLTTFADIEKRLRGGK